MKGVVLAGTSSGVGKTVATLATIRALQQAGHEVQPAKAGPDFIDPSHHAQVAGTPSRTLDTWLSGTDGCRRNYHRGEGDVCVVEGVMGLYDGDVSSTAAVAAALDLPVVLVVDASAGMESVAATALGFRAYVDEVDVDVDVAGVLAQRAHGGRHERGIRDALPDGLAYIGRVPPREGLEIPDRHLGLHMGDEAPVDEDALDSAAEHVRVDRLLELARPARRPTAGSTADPSATEDDGRPTVAVAHDDAFRFVYPATLERLRALADVTTFAPVAGDSLPDCDAVYLPGGYPERHAATLSSAPALASLADRAADGLPVLGECGGLMALSRSIRTVDGDEYPMAGVLPADVRLHDRYQALDHVELRATADGPTATTDTSLRGHEFHYSSATPDADARFAFELLRGDGITDGMDGLTEYRTVGTYCHCHAASGAFDRLVGVAAATD
ncbi:cobyrinic acid a,c-diamide synthase [Haloarchaeobius baliensis]|uniref:cobyrinic acid a,c-diamide synthase n=1 Tax=Haloarchaeobius baliensis TaxID=1670458 RepID=UPI003F882128